MRYLLVFCDQGCRRAMSLRTSLFQYLTPVLLYAAAFCFPLGLILPLMRMEKLFFFEETPSLFDLVTGLYDKGDLALSAIIAVFSFIFPAVKLFLLFTIAFGTTPHHRLKVLSALGKWSMMDVMLVALVVFAAKTSGVASALALPGLWFFAAATLFSALAAMIIRKSNQPA